MRSALLLILAAGTVTLPVRALPQAVALGGALCPAERATPTAPTLQRTGFLTLLDEIRREHAKRAGDGIPALDRALVAAKTDDAGANSAFALTVSGGASAAVYATAWSCARKPDNATFASNLGALLEGLEDERALGVLSYAVSLDRGGLLPNVNVGWYLFNHGQLAKAKRAFATAARKAPDLAPVLFGQGMVAHCQGDHRAAIQFLSRALSVVSSPSAEQALEASQAHEAEQESQQVSSSPGPAPVPRRDDWRGARPPRVVIVPPVVPGSNQEHLSDGLARNGAIVKGYDELTQALIARQRGLRPNAGRERAPVRTATSLTLYRGDDAMVALARAQYTAYDVRRRAARAPFERDFEQQRARVSDLVQQLEREAQAGPLEKYLESFCAKLTPAMEREYGRFKISWRGAWEAERNVIDDYGTTAARTISRIRHDDLRRYLDIERQLHLITMGLDGPADVIGWGAVGGAIMVCGARAQEPGSASVEPSDETEKAPCPPFLQNGFGVNVVVASVSLDCEKITFQAGGEGVVGRFEQNYVKHEQTYFLGAGADGSALEGAIGVGVEGSAGVFVTCSGNTVRDMGFQASGSGAVGPLKGELSGTIGVFSGPSGGASGSLDVGPVSVPL